MERGEKAYASACASCHQPDGTGMPPAFPALKGSQIATEDMAAHIDIVVNGKSGTAMQAFGGQLSEVDLAAVITYRSEERRVGREGWCGWGGCGWTSM